MTNARVTVQRLRHFAVEQVHADIAGDGYTLTLDANDTIGLGNVTQSASAWNQFEQCATGDSVKPIFAVSEIVGRGLLTPNSCNAGVKISRRPGEIVFFVRPLTIRERIHDWWAGVG